MTEQVGIDSEGRLWGSTISVDDVVTSGSDHAVSSNAVWNYGNSLADNAHDYVDEQIQVVKSDYTSKIQTVQTSLDQTNGNITNLTARVGNVESDIASIQQKNTQQDTSISQINSDITALQQKNSQQDIQIQQVQTNLDNQVSNLEGQIQNVKTEIESDYDEQISGLQQQITSNDNDIVSLQSGLSTANQNISSNTSKISTNSSNITTLQQRCTTIEEKISTNTSNISSLTTRVGTAESNIQTQTSRINTIDSTVSNHTTQITSLQNEENGRFFTSEEELLQWVSSQTNTKDLQVGAGLYVNDDNSMYYIWDGNGTLRFQYIEVPDGGYMVRNNPVGVGSITMNNCQAGTGTAAFGQNNVANVLDALVGGTGISVIKDNGFGVGSYNQMPSENEVFSVGVGTSDASRKTAMRLISNGNQDVLGDLKVFSSSLSPSGYPFLAECHYSIKSNNIPDNVLININYDLFYSFVTISEDSTYTLTYAINGWYTTQIASGVNTLSEIGITFVYTDETQGSPEINFSIGDSITIYAPPQPEISLRDFYSDFASMRLYVDADGDVCQKDS